MPTSGAARASGMTVTKLCQHRLGRSTGLLASVRNRTETAAALAGGATVIDVKEPAQGPLGRAPDAAIRGVLGAVGDRALVSLALGELADWRDSPPPAGAAVAKFGLAGQAGAGWPAAVSRAAERLPAEVAVAVVAYADAASRSPDPEGALGELAPCGCGWLVIDTFDKKGPSSVRLLGLERLERLTRAAEEIGVGLVIAGGLSLDEAADVATLRPTLVGLRGALCVGGRAGSLSQRLVEVAARRVADCARIAGPSRRDRNGGSPPLPSP